MRIPHLQWTGPVLGRVATAFGVLVLAACGGAPADRPSTSNDRIQVVATTTIVADLVRAIGEPDVEVVSLMGAGVDPHLYKPSAGDVRRMGAARAIFYNGLHLEGKMADVLEEMGRRGVTTVAVAECLPEDRLLEVAGGGGIHDPHVWFDVDLWMDAVPCTIAALSEIAPDHRDAFRQRAAAFLDQLQALEAEVRAAIDGIPAERRVLITAHDAFAYFGRAYGLEVRGLLGVSTASEAGIGDVQDLAEYIAQQRIPAVFVETSVPARYVEALQEAVTARGFAVRIGGSLYSDALGDPDTAAATYVGTVRANVETIVAALGGERPSDDAGPP
jgi:manganese/zinc/iron transport system substrate-binding protein